MTLISHKCVPLGGLSIPRGLLFKISGQWVDVVSGVQTTEVALALAGHSQIVKPIIPRGTTFGNLLVFECPGHGYVP